MPAAFRAVAYAVLLLLLLGAASGVLPGLAGS
ncbi:hypothetical protein ruthe_00706 [Rubellimicrobium thermophilum DSM 16684]|uniref:Uncharacterized protein n=1 Tax=Rubellimicrobium thermophilum DSM 16684 TaxID=1123069 RepID=S9R5X7_9RHOB|nr:hypothetical protein ruthe_00706 [Rubellimicrobium thermophilum DSM 16684]